MNLFDIILTSFALALDAFTVSICKGIVIKKDKFKKSLIIGLYFGLFQLFMTLIGYLFGNMFYEIIINFSNIISFIFLLIIGINMIIESKNNNEFNDKIIFKEMIFLSIATSIDALIIGITLSLLRINIILVITIIGLITLLLSFIGVLFGNIISKKLIIKPEIVGGFILIMLGIKILFE